MTDKSEEQVNVVFKPKGSSNPSELRTVGFKVNKDFADKADDEEIVKIAKRKAVDDDIISPRSSLKYWEVKDIQIGDNKEDNGNSNKSGYYGLGVASRRNKKSKNKRDKDNIGYYGPWI